LLILISMKKDVSYREFTKHFLDKLKTKKAEFFRVVNATEGD
jgi:hypothetical protein